MVGIAALLAWPVVVILLYRSLPFRDALIWSLIGGYLLLPSSLSVFIDLPLLPPYDKDLVPPVAAAIIGAIVLRHRKATAAGGARRPGTPAPPEDVNPLPGWLPRSFLGMGLLLMLGVGTIMTAQTNGDRLQYGELILPGQTMRDAFSNLLVLGVAFLPMLLGRKYLSDDKGHKRLLVIFFISAMIYTLPALFEIRMSPRLNVTVYGFFPHSWLQHIRAGGWRPLVFLDHGLLLGIHFACALIAGVILVRLETSGRRLMYVAALGWLAVALLLSKTLGAFMIAAAMVPVAFLMPVRLQLMLAATIAMITMVYPILRGSGTVPTDNIVAAAAGIDGERAGSLQFRFDNEDQLLDKASERPVFGWGWWSRARVYDENGRDISVTDGSWIIIIGEIGWIGYLSHFGLLTIPIMLFFLRRRRYDISLVTSGLCLVTAANLIDLLPNSSLTPVLWLCAGALLGRLERAREALPDAVPDRAGNETSDTTPEVVQDPDPDLVMTRYSRFPVNKTREGAVRPQVSRRAGKR